MIKFDYRRMINENMTEDRRLFKPDGIFDKCGATSISRFLKGYSASIGFFVESEQNRKEYYKYDILISQDGVTLKYGFISPKSRERDREFVRKVVAEAAQKMIVVYEELKKYQFEPCGYVLYPDNPNTPYYLRKEEAYKFSDVILFKDDKP